MGILLLCLLAVLMILYLISRKRYEAYMAPVDPKRYPLKKMMPIALYLLEKVGYSYKTKYDKRLIVKIAQISGHQQVNYYLTIHWANKLTLLWIVLVLITFIGAGITPDGAFGVFSLLLVVSVVYFSDRELNECIRKRARQLQLEFPDFLNKLTLLVNAGMTIHRAWEKIASDHKKDSPLYEELRQVILDIKGGKSEVLAYEDFAKRCRLSEITRFASVIIQNLRRGNSDVVSILRLQANECWENRKNTAKRMGEEASTKMLLPMMIMFMAILIIVAVPAVLAMQGI